jgi:5-bromo-4-chloroindolyl phosphate hydrolysis protein
MDDKEFQKLKKELEEAIDEVERLQKIYRKETGKDFVKPLYIGD